MLYINVIRNNRDEVIITHIVDRTEFCPTKFLSFSRTLKLVQNNNS